MNMIVTGSRPANAGRVDTEEMISVARQPSVVVVWVGCLTTVCIISQLNGRKVPTFKSGAFYSP